jgi:hypothetical protein
METTETIKRIKTISWPKWLFNTVIFLSVIGGITIMSIIVKICMWVQVHVHITW